jgi:hypothetical protein
MKGNILHMTTELPYHIIVKHIDDILNKYEKSLADSCIYPVEAIDEVCDYLYDNVGKYQIDSISSVDGMYRTYVIALPHPDDSITIPFMFHVYSY